MPERDTTSRRALLACLYAAVPTGCFYGFALYSKSLRKHYSLTLAQMDNINTLPYLFGVLNPMWGMVSQRIGPRLSVCIGGSIIASMQVLMYILSTAVPASSVPAPPVLLVVVTVVQYFGLGFITSGAFSTVVLHFPLERGPATGLVKTFTGLGGAVVSQLYVLCFGVPGDGPEALNALLLWAGIVLSCTAIGTYLMPARPSEARAEVKQLLRALFFALLSLGLFTTVCGLVSTLRVLHNVLTPLVLLLVLLPLPLGLAPWLDKRPTSAHAEDDAEPAALHLQSAGGEPLRFEAAVSLSFGQMLRTVDAWLLWWAGAGAMGGGLLLATNMAQILVACRAEPSLLPTAVTLFSTGNMLGRLMSMAASDALVRRGRPRPLFVAMINALMAATHLGFLILALAPGMGSAGQSALVALAAACGGLSFGAIWPHLVVLSSELFGSEHLTVNYMFYDGGCAAFGNVVLGNLIPSAIYRAAKGGAGEAVDCIGPSCFAASHGIIAAINLTAALASVVLSLRCARLYDVIGSSVRALESTKARYSVKAADGAADSEVAWAGAAPAAGAEARPTVALMPPAAAGSSSSG